jgi:hypothetical protein
VLIGGGVIVLLAVGVGYLIARASVEQQPPGEQAHRQPPGGRAVRADILVIGADSADGKPTTSFVRGRNHQVEVWIGHQRDASPTTISAKKEATAEEAPFPEGAVAQDPGRYTKLLVTFSDSRRVITKPLDLPNNREVSSTRSTFELVVAPDLAKVAAMITIRQNNRTLQQLVLKGETVAVEDDNVGEDRIELIEEVVARPIEQPSEGTSFDVSINRSSIAESCVLMHDGEALLVSPWDDGIRQLVDDIAAEIYDAGRAAAAGDGDTEWVELIRLLAGKGNQLRSWLERTPGYHKLIPAQRIQLVDADATRPLPIEIVYDGGRVDPENGTPCPNWDEALATGHCVRCAALRELPDDRKPFRFPICPMGFWGLTKVIERQTGKSELPPGRLDPLCSVMFAASDQVRQQDYDATIDVLTTALRQPPTTVTAWEDWAQAIREHRPTLIVALPHQDRTATNLDYLQIGLDSKLYSGDVSDDMVTAGHGPGPVVLLLGCRTANASATFQNFVAEFRTKGAPVVLGTLATVLGRDAAAIAQAFVRELASAGADTPVGNGIPFGEAMRSVRRLMVAKKNAAALGLIAFGDSDWQVAVHL